MSDNEKEAAEDLLKSSGKQRRHETDPDQSTDSDDSPSTKEAIRDVYAELEADERSSNLTIRDEDLAALIVGLENSGQLEDVATDAFAALDRELEEDVTRATALKGLVRVGLDRVAADVTDTAVEAKRDHLASQADSF